MLKFIYEKKYILLFLFIFLYWIIFQIIYPKSMSSGDSGALILYSKLIAEEMTLLTKNYYYPTELRFLWVSNIYAPLFYIFNNYDYVRLFANIILYIILLTSFILLIKQYDIDINYAFLAMAVFLIPISNHYLYIGIISSFYLVYYILSILLFALLIGLVRSDTKKWLYLTAYIILTFMYSLNGIRALINVFVPLFLSCTALYILERFVFKVKMKLNIIWYSMLGLAVSMLGYFISDHFLRDIVHYVDYTQSRWYSFDITQEKIVTFISGIFKQLVSTYYWGDIVSVMSNLGIILVTVLFFYMLYYVFVNSNNIYIRLLLIFFAASFLEQIAIGLIFTGYKARYLYPVTIFIPAIVAVYAYITKDIKIHRSLILIFIGALFIHGSAVVINTFSEDRHKKQSYFIYVPPNKEQFKSIIEFLDNNKINFGYSLYSEAHLLDELSNGKIEGGGIRISKCEFYPMKWDTLTKYYERTNIQDNIYFMISNKINDECQKSNKLLKDKKYDYRDNKYTLYIIQKEAVLDYLKIIK